MTIADPGHGITLGGLALVQDGRPVEHPEWFTTEVSADGTTWGNPEVAVAQIISALHEGDLVRQAHVGNREPVLHVRITAATANDLALGERALARVVGKPAELVWQPPDYFAPPTVFDVLHSRMDWEFDDLGELRCERTYVITMTALPRGRSQEKTITPAVSGAAPSVVDNGSATTNWSAPYGPTGTVVSVSSGAVTATYNASILNTRPGFPFYGTTTRRTATIATTTDKYLGIDWKTTSTGYFFLSADSALLVEVRREPAPTATYARSWYKVADATASVSQLQATIDRAGNPGSSSETLQIDQIVQANALPASGTTKQQIATVKPKGSVPTEGDVLVQHASAGLGIATVFSHPAGGGYSPPLRPWRTSSDTVTSESTAVSGSKNALTGLTRFNIPMESVPEGDVHLWARVRSTAGTGDALLNWSAWSLMGSATVGDPQFGSVFVNFPTITTWVMAPIARMTLPTSRIGPAGFVYIDLQRDFTSSGLTIELDEAYLFAMDKGQLTVVDCGSGTPSVGSVHNRLRVTAPSLDAPQGRIEVATQADWGDAFVPPYSKVLCDQRGHSFDPSEGTMVMTVTAVTDSATSFEHYARAHSNIGDF